MFSLHTHSWPRSSSWPAHITWIQTNQCWAARHATPGDTLPYHLYICDSETVKSYLYHGNVQNVFKIIFWSYFILADYQWASQSRFCVFPLIQSWDYFLCVKSDWNIFDLLTTGDWSAQCCWWRWSAAQHPGHTTLEPRNTGLSREWTLTVWTCDHPRSESNMWFILCHNK